MVIMAIDSSRVAGFHNSGYFSSVAFVGSCRHSCNIYAATTNDPIASYPSFCHSVFYSGEKFSISRGTVHATDVGSRGMWMNGLVRNRNTLKNNKVRAAPPEHSGSSPDPLEFHNGTKPCYHPSEEIGEAVSVLDGEEDARLSDAEVSRTMIEVNSKATLLFSGIRHGEVQGNVILPELPYVTDEHGDIYFKVDGDEDILQMLTADSNYVQVIIGLDSTELFTEIELSSRSDIDFGIEEIIDEDSDNDDDDDDDDDDDSDDVDDDEDWVTMLEDEDEDSDILGDWANLETMRSSHPMYFARRIAESVLNPRSDWMDQPCTGLAIQGMLRPAFIEEESTIRKNMSGYQTDQMEKVESLPAGTTFFKLEIVKIQLASAYGDQSVVKIEDFRQAEPDAIAHSATKIIHRLKDGGDKIVQALKSICWRCKGVPVEEAVLIGVDSLGFDLRVCSGTQVQTLRFAFKTRATSEYSAERQLHELLFPRTHPKVQNRKEAHQNEC